MRWGEILHRLPSDAVRRMRLSDVWRASSAIWPQPLLQPDELAVAVGRLSAWARRLLEYWVREVGPLPVQEEKLFARSVPDAGMAVAEMRAGIRELCACGLLFAVRKSWGERLLFMPADCYLAWRLVRGEEDVWAELTRCSSEAVSDSAGVNRQGCSGEPSPSPAIEPPDAAPGAPLARRLMRAYAALARQGLALTAKGLFPKKTVDLVSRLVALPDSGLAARLRPVHADAYPVSFAIAMDIAGKLGLIHIQDGTYRWSDSAREGWLSGDERVREAEMVQLVTMLYGCRSPQEAFFASGLLKLEPNRQYRTSDDWKRDSHPSDWMRFLHACGWAYYEAGIDGGYTFRWLIDPLAGRSAAADGQGTGEPVMVLPDGELIVPPYAGLTVRWKLEQIAQWVRDDVVAIYRITAESVASAVEQGFDSDSLLAAIQAAAGGAPPPDELVHAVRHWSAGACRTVIEEVALLRCHTKEIADAVAMRPELKELLVERLGDYTYIVRSEETAKLRKELERAGWPPLQQGDGCRKSGPAAAASSVSGKKRSGAQPLQPGAPSAFIYNEHAVDRFELLVPAADGAGGAVEDIPSEWPAAWTGELRSYHHSTRKQMIEGALEWGAPVQLITEGQSVELLPQRLDVATKPWQVSGYIRRENAADYEPVRLTPDMWEEMRIVIPRPAPRDIGS